MKFFKSSLASLLLICALPASAQVLYKVEGNGLKEPSYIFGTHHLAPLSVIETFGASEPFNSATQVVGEIDMTQNPMELQMAMQPHMMAPADSTLTKVLPADEFPALNEEFKKWAPMQGMELSMLDPMKPMVVTTMVTVGIVSGQIPDYNPNEQLDTWFQATGAANGKKIVPLETAEQQAALLFDFTPISLQAEALVEMLKDPQKSVDSAKKLTEAYMKQDLPAMLELSEKDDEHPEFMEALLDKRNADWLTKLPGIFNDGSTFVAVGALHLAGDKGVIEGLRKLGYTVTPIK
ncbi:MAG: TraB/GumN family protein [Muribaculaceae bacterium]|nr:TraB/GumN family protein [Muribaculaceae bacterium]MDE6770040.1 TraB/GumN family protein [Muribaculaceae bacterium]